MYSEYQRKILSDKFQAIQNLERELVWAKHKKKMQQIYGQNDMKTIFDHKPLEKEYNDLRLEGNAVKTEKVNSV